MFFFLGRGGIFWNFFSNFYHVNHSTYDGDTIESKTPFCQISGPSRQLLTSTQNLEIWQFFSIFYPNQYFEKLVTIIFFKGKMHTKEAFKQFLEDMLMSICIFLLLFVGHFFSKCQKMRVFKSLEISAEISTEKQFFTKK